MKLIYLSFLTWMAFGCQETQPVTEVTAKASGSSEAAAVPTNNESDSSEGVVGPDEAYFAGVYLESLFKASKANPQLSLSDSGLALSSNGQVEAFDFAANLQPRRMDLMGRILIKLGDKDGDQKLSYDEFGSIKLIPELKGASGAAMGHEFTEELFKAAAGEDGYLSESEIQNLLAKTASASDLSKLSKSDFKKALIGGWEKVIASYDENKDGKASLEEQRKLRKDRALIMSRFTAE
ncbi:MAG: hypothetical protein EOP07_01750 [Proteobacteria bacterium]|nr:MAG: hypothetical protein EOP07_01750 [Pseudomonadota bacterium]